MNSLGTGEYATQVYTNLTKNMLQLYRVKEWSPLALRVAYRLTEIEAHRLHALLAATPYHPHWEK